jgi:acyl-CoA dehydrogenase
MLRKPVEDADRYGRVWKNHVEPLDGAYEMTP